VRRSADRRPLAGISDLGYLISAESRRSSHVSSDYGYRIMSSTQSIIATLEDILCEGLRAPDDRQMTSRS
jgi:hypothetical protein